MRNIKGRKKANKYGADRITKELKNVDTLVAELEQDKSLPTFVDHFLLCIMLGTSECVNLKTMYPKAHRRLKLFVQDHSNK